VVAVTELLFIVLLVLVVLVAIVGLFAVTTPYESERQRLAREAREADRRITEIGRQAQAAILAEALKRAQAKPTATRTDRARDDEWHAPWPG
jgi:hypothetical protein